MNNPITWSIYIAALITSLIIYFLPTIFARKKAFVLKVFFLNLLLGWTVLGWLVALAWAFKKPTQLSQTESNINDNTNAELEKLNLLLKNDVITDEEFDSQKHKLVSYQMANPVINQLSIQKKLQIASAIIMLFVMLVCLTCYFYVVPKYIYGTEATARTFLNGLQNNSLSPNLMSTNYIDKVNQSSYIKIYSYNITKVVSLSDDKFKVIANVETKNSLGIISDQQVSIVIQKQFDNYTITDTYNIVLTYDTKIVFDNSESDLQKINAQQNLANELEIASWDYDIDFGEVHGKGVIKNNSKHPVKFIEAEIKYLNKTQQVINTHKTYAVNDSALQPNQSRLFSWITPNCGACVFAKITLLINAKN